MINNAYEHKSKDRICNSQSVNYVRGMERFPERKCTIDSRHPYWGGITSVTSFLGGMPLCFTLAPPSLDQKHSCFPPSLGMDLMGGTRL